MKTTEPSPVTVDAVRARVLQTLCARDRLDAGQAELRQAWVLRNGQRCGAFFQVRGPRLMRSYAVWAGDEGRILFYESTGQRFAELRLAHGGDLPRAA